MRLSIIIPTCNRPNELRSCLGALVPQLADISTGEIEIVVTDDGRRQVANEEDLQRLAIAVYSKGPGRGPAANRNYGASIASGEILLFLDDDCLPQPGYLKSYWEFWQAVGNEQAINVHGPTIAIGERKSLLFEAPNNPNGSAFISANFSIPKKLFQTVGGFDERYEIAAFEDIEFFERFSRLGGKTSFLVSAVVFHPFRKIGNPKSLAKKWESRIIYAYDQGAKPATLYFRFPWHVLRVIISRFRNQGFSIGNVLAGGWFLSEWMLVLLFTPYWISKWSRRQRSPFWLKRRGSDCPVPNNGL